MTFEEFYFFKFLIDGFEQKMTDFLSRTHLFSQRGQSFHNSGNSQRLVVSENCVLCCDARLASDERFSFIKILTDRCGICDA